MIKKIISYTIFYLVKCFHFTYSYKTSRKVKEIRDRIYTFWIRNNIHQIDHSSGIGIDCTLLGGQYMKIGEKTTIGRHCVLTCWDEYRGEKLTPSLIIGNNCAIGEYAHITAINSIVIGNNVLTGRRITITDNYHGKSQLEDLELPPSKRNLYSKGPVIIGDNVWIGDKVSIMSGVHIGDNTVIAANSVVTKDIPKNSVAAGIPAIIIRNN